MINKKIRPIIIDGVGDIERCVRVMRHTFSTLNKCRLDIQKPIIFSPKDFIDENIYHQKINKLSYKEYNDTIVSLGKVWHDESFALFCQGDGYPINHLIWTDEFLNYDYIGAPWPKHLNHNGYIIKNRVGNGGFSLRSAKLLRSCSELIPMDGNNEDLKISEIYRSALEDKYKIKFPSVDIAAKFSYENDIEERTFGLDKCFGFHDFKNGPVAEKLKYNLQ